MSTKEVPEPKATLTKTKPRFASIMALKSWTGNLGMTKKSSITNTIPVAKS